MEQDNYDISIIVPVYNAQLYLDRCVTSLLAQTLRVGEIILVNDGSTDQSGSICASYAARDRRVRVLHLQNGGPARARNQGIHSAKGKYIGFVDADDYVDSTMFESLFEEAERTCSDIAMCGYAMDKSGFVSQVTMDYEPLYSGTEIKSKLIRRFYSGNHNGLYSLCNKLFRRSFIINNNLVIDESMYRGEDAWFVFDCLKLANIVSFLPKALYFYYQNPASIMHSVSKDQFAKWSYSRSRLLEENRQLQFSLDLDEFYRDYLYKTVLFCREMVRCNESALVKTIMEDQVLIEAIQYRRNLPGHVRILLWLMEKKYVRIAIMAYRVWGFRK